MAFRGTTTVRFEVPPEVVFDYLADPAHRPDWQSSLRRVELVADAPADGPGGRHGVGARWVDHTAVGVQPRMETTVYERPTRWAEVGGWRGLEAELTLTFTARGEAATDVRADLGFGGPRVWLPLAFVLSKVSPPPVAADLRRAARILADRSSGRA